MGKWFDPKSKSVEITPLPDEQVDQRTIKSLVDFLMVPRPGISTKTAQIIVERSLLNYRQRLAANITSMMSCLGERRIHDVLTDGLTEIEKAALAELQRAGLTSAQLIAAHLLLGITDRVEMLQYLKGIMPVCKRRHAG